MKILENLLNENPALRMQLQKQLNNKYVKNPETKKDVKVATALANKEHPAHDKAKNIFIRLRDKLRDALGDDWVYENKSVNEATKRSVSKIVDAISKITTEMKTHAGYYVKAKNDNKPKDMKKHLEHLKQLTAKKNTLEKELDDKIGALDKDVELKATDESVLRSLIRNKIVENLQTNLNEGTRSQVGFIDKNGKIQSGYVHFDGYPSNMKKGLKKHMKSEKDVMKLIKLGGARGLYNDKDVEYYNEKPAPIKGDVKNIRRYFNDSVGEGSAEYVYLYNTKDKKWYYASTYDDKELKLLESKQLTEAVPSHGRQLQDAEVDKLYKIEKRLDDPYYPKKVIGKQGRSSLVED